MSRSTHRASFLALLLSALLSLLAGGCASTQGERRGPEVAGRSQALTQIDTVFDAVSIVADASRVFCAACPTGLSQTGTAYIFMLPADGGAARVLNTTPLWGSPAGLEIHGEHLVVAVHPEPEGRMADGARPMTGVYRIPMQGGPAEPLWEGEPFVRPNRMAIVGSTIYVADMEAGPNGSGAILSLPVEGGKPVVVAQGPPLEDPIGLVASSSGLFIGDRGRAAERAAHKDPGSPGMILFLAFDSKEPEIVARGGLLKNPLDLEMVGDTLYIADEGSNERARQGVYKLSTRGWKRGANLTSSVTVVHEGEPFVEPIALAAVRDRLYIADDTKSKSFLMRVPAPSAESAPTTARPPR